MLYNKKYYVCLKAQTALIQSKIMFLEKSNELSLSVYTLIIKPQREWTRELAHHGISQAWQFPNVLPSVPISQ